MNNNKKQILYRVFGQYISTESINNAEKQLSTRKILKTKEGFMSFVLMLALQNKLVINLSATRMGFKPFLEKVCAAGEFWSEKDVAQRFTNKDAKKLLKKYAQIMPVVVLKNAKGTENIYLPCSQLEDFHIFLTQHERKKRYAQEITKAKQTVKKEEPIIQNEPVDFVELTNDDMHNVAIRMLHKHKKRPYISESDAVNATLEMMLDLKKRKIR